MLLRFSRALRLGLLCLLASGSAGAQVTTRLPSGVTLILDEAHEAPIVAIEVFVRAGSGRETAETAASAHMLEHVSFRSTANHPAGALDAEAERLGYELNANTQRDFTRYYATALSKDWKTVLGLLADAVLNPRPTRADLSRERRVLMQEYFSHRDDPIEMAFGRLTELAYGEVGYGASVAGSVDAIRAVTLETVQAFHDRWYTTGNTIVVLVGDLSLDEAKEQVEGYFGAMRRAETDPFVAPPSPEPRAVEEDGPYSRPAIGLAYPAVAASKIEDSALLDILVALINLRAAAPGVFDPKPLAFSVEYTTISHPGLVTLVAYAEEGTMTDAAAALDREMARLHDGGFTKEEFAAARARALGSELFEHETYAGRAYTLGYWATVGGPDVAERYRKALEAATFEQAARVAKQVFDPSKGIRLSWRARKEGGS